MGYNTANDPFELVFVSFLSKEDTQIFIDLYSFLSNSHKLELNILLVILPWQISVQLEKFLKIMN